MVFELAVFRCLQKVSLTNSKENNQAALLDLHNELEQLQASLTGTMPVLGLMEMQLWAKSKLEGIPLKQLFLQVVHENLEAMGWSAKTHSQ